MVFRFGVNNWGYYYLNAHEIGLTKNALIHNGIKAF
ncbi:Uncharacterised protein [Streptococcus pneumoniae]|nr:Uncharacterised protein [Streptococcus pneumoniae]